MANCWNHSKWGSKLKQTLEIDSESWESCVKAYGTQNANRNYQILVQNQIRETVTQMLFVLNVIKVLSFERIRFNKRFHYKENLATHMCLWLSLWLFMPVGMCAKQLLPSLKLVFASLCNVFVMGPLEN